MGTESEGLDREVQVPGTFMHGCLGDKRRRYNNHTDSCSAHFSVVKKGNKQWNYIGDWTSEFQDFKSWVIACCKCVLSVWNCHFCCTFTLQQSTLLWLSPANFPNMKTGVCPLKFPPWCFLRDLKLKYNLLSHKTWKHERTPLLTSQLELFRLKRSHKLEFPLAWISKKIDRDIPVRRLSDSMIQVGPSSRRDRELSPVPYDMTRRCLFLKKMQNVGRKGGRFWCSCKLCWVLRTRFNTCGSTIVHTGLFSDSASIVSNRNLHWVPGVSTLLTQPAQLKWRKVAPSKL